jgi:hypothetical protein
VHPNFAFRRALFARGNHTLTTRVSIGSVTRAHGNELACRTFALWPSDVEQLRINVNQWFLGVDGSSTVLESHMDIVREARFAGHRRGVDLVHAWSSGLCKGLFVLAIVEVEAVETHGVEIEKLEMW